MKDITIFENFINDEELEEARQFIYVPGTTCKSIHNGQIVTDWFFYTDDNCDKKFIFEVSEFILEVSDCGITNMTSSAIKFISKIKNRIYKCTNKTFDLQRVYLNRQVYGQDVPLHKDTDKFNGYTLLIYIGDITPENYDKAGGDLEFKNKEKTRVEPFTQRAVLFKGYIPHQAYAPLVPGLTRIVFAFKFFCMSEKVPFIVKYS